MATASPANPKSGGSQGGRPHDYEPEEMLAILKWMASGKSLNSYCLQEGAPHVTTVLRWVASDEQFRDEYAKAQKMREDVIFDQMMQIADTTQEGKVVVTETAQGRTSVKTTTSEMTKHRELQINTRKWVLSRMNPRRFGDKIQVAGHDAGPLKVVEAKMTPQEAAEAYAATLDPNQD